MEYLKNEKPKKQNKINHGKQFETQIRKAFEQIPNVSVDRLIDPMGMYAGVKNVSDFIIYKWPNEYYIECKSCYGASLPFSNITDYQWESLLEKSKIQGVRCYVIVWFIDKDITTAMPIGVLKALKDAGFKSVKAEESFQFDGCILLSGRKRKVLFDYDLRSFFDDTSNDKRAFYRYS